MQRNEVLFSKSLWQCQHASSIVIEVALGEYMSQGLHKYDGNNIVDEFGYQVLKIPDFDRFSFKKFIGMTLLNKII